MNNGRILCVIGPTAVGKTELSVKIAQRFGGEIVSCDSMQLYKFLDIGSAKPSMEEQGGIPHHLVDEIDPREAFSVSEYQRLALAAIRDIMNRGRLPVITGGTGLYLDSILFDMDFSFSPTEESMNRRRELEKIAACDDGPVKLCEILRKSDPEAASRIHPNNVRRVIRAIEASEADRKLGDFSKDLRPREGLCPVIIGLTRGRRELYDRIDKRVDKMIEAGLAEEVRGLLSAGLGRDNISMQGIGYKEIAGFLYSEYDFDEAVRLIKRNTRHFAKRQMTWFRRYKGAHWFDISENVPENGTEDGAESVPADTFIPAVKMTEDDILNAVGELLAGGEIGGE